jgi:cytoskeleton protein RodZ
LSDIARDAVTTAALHAETTLLGVGKALAQARLEQGLEIADIAQQLKFMPRQIESLEAERFESLPGPTIARGMVRSYARFLKLDPEPLLERMVGRFEARDATPQLAARFSQPVPFSDSGKRSTVVYLALSGVVLAIAAGVFYEWRHDRGAEQLAAAAPASAKPRASVPAKSPAAAAPVAVEPASLPPVASPKASAPPAPPPPPVTVEAAAPKMAGEPAVPKMAGEPAVLKTAGPNRLVLRFEEEAWAEVTDSAGRQLVSSLNPAGSERVVRGTPPFSLVIGNAQHVKVNYNNREVDLQPHVKVEVARFTLK